MLSQPDHAIWSNHDISTECLTVAASEPKNHHYVPQFYLRRFVCRDDQNKVQVLERHRDIVVSDRKSIRRIGHEERMHDFEVGGVAHSIEGALNRAVETPFSTSSTWLKISSGNCAGLNGTDRLPIYGFARHLQLRSQDAVKRFREQPLDGFPNGISYGDLHVTSSGVRERLSKRGPIEQADQRRRSHERLQKIGVRRERGGAELAVQHRE